MEEVVIIGQRRSGTSMLAGILYYLSIDMGIKPGTEEWKETNQETWANPEGFFEDRRIIEISESILGENSNRNRIIKKYGDKIESVIRERREEAEGIWGFKDVNQLIVHDIYQNYLENPYYLLLLRDAQAVAESKVNWHENLDLDDTRSASIRKNNRIVEMHSKLKNSYPVFVLSYEKILRKQEENIDKIIDFLEISEEGKQDAVNHINPFINIEKP